MSKNKKKKNMQLTWREVKALEIFKLQIPLNPNESALCLVYNKKETIVLQYPAEEVWEFFAKDEFKRYMYGFVDKDGAIQLFALPRLPEQDW